MGNCFGAPSESGLPAAAAHFQSGGRSMKPFVGCNCYYLMTRASDEGTRPMVLHTLDAMQRMGFTVVRIWAFNDGPGWMSLQPQPGEYTEQVLVGLDWLLVEAGKRGLQLMMTLTNFWNEFGGMPQYVKWSQGIPDGTKIAAGDAFFTDIKAQQLYKDFVTMLVSRTNSISGVAYREDPAIHSWDLANEPRCEGDSGATAIARWLHEAAAHVKSLDSNHMVTCGLEGFFGNSCPGLLPANPYNVTHGTDFVREFSSPHLDFASIHMYADQWCPGTDQKTCSWSVEWVRAHIAACQQQLGGKPLVLQEFGKRPAGPGRSLLFSQMRQLLQESLASGGALQGAMVWMFAHESYPDYDGYTVYSSGAPDAAAAEQGVQPVVPDAESAHILQQMCKEVAVTPS